jgi:hypothetical protein
MPALKNGFVNVSKYFRFQCGPQTKEDWHGWFSAPSDQGRCYEMVSTEGPCNQNVIVFFMSGYMWEDSGCLGCMAALLK